MPKVFSRLRPIFATTTKHKNFVTISSSVPNVFSLTSLPTPLLQGEGEKRNHGPLSLQERGVGGEVLKNVRN